METISNQLDQLEKISVDQLILGIGYCEKICKDLYASGEEYDLDDDVAARYRGFTEGRPTRDSHFLRYRSIGFELIKAVLRQNQWEKLIPFLEKESHFSLVLDFLMEYRQVCAVPHNAHVFSLLQNPRMSEVERNGQLFFDLTIGERAHQEVQQTRIAMEDFLEQYEKIFYKLNENKALNNASLLILWDLIFRCREEIIRDLLKEAGTDKAREDNVKFIAAIARFHFMIRNALSCEYTHYDDGGQQAIDEALKTLLQQSNEGMALASLWLGLVYRYGIHDDVNKAFVAKDGARAQIYFQKYFVQGGRCFPQYVSALLLSVAEARFGVPRSLSTLFAVEELVQEALPQPMEVELEENHCSNFMTP